jgi:hypothetical protein
LGRGTGDGSGNLVRGALAWRTRAAENPSGKSPHGWDRNTAALLSVRRCSYPAVESGLGVKLSEVQQQVIQSRTGQIVGAENFDRLFAGAVFTEVADQILYAFAPTESLAAEIEENYALHLSIVVGRVTGVPVEFVQVLPDELREQG